MSKELVESIISNNMLDANDMVEAKLAEIRERKLYEMKRMFAAEAFGMLKFTKAEIEKKKAQGYRKASDVLGDPSKIKIKPISNAKKRKTKKQVEEGVVDDVTHAVKKGARRTSTRLQYGLGYAIGKGLGGAMKAAGAAQSGASAVKGAGEKAYGATLKGISDPLETAGKAAKGLGRAGVAATKATARGTKKAALAVAKSRIGQKIANYRPDPPGTAVVNAAKKFGDAPVWNDLSRLSGL